MTLKALVAEDDPNIRSMLAMSLELEGYDVISVADGGSAIQILDEESVDVVLLDVMMPVKSGYDVVRHLRSSAAAETPVIMVSAKTSDDDVWEGWRVGVDSYVTKPYDVDLLVAEMERVTKNSFSAGKSAA